MNTTLAYIGLALLSLIIGSLLNVVIYRLPLMLQAQWQADCALLLKVDTKATRPKINLFFPRSFCRHCHKMIPAWHNIPLLSYLLLRGRCHNCQQAIAKRYPAVELLTLVLSLLAAWHFGFTWVLPFVLLALWLLICLFFIDLDHQLLPDCLTLSLLWLGLLANSLSAFIPLTTAVYSTVGAYLSLWLFIQLFYALTGKVGMGNGDFKLFAAFGAWLGWSLLPFVLVLASCCGVLIGGGYLWLSGKPRSTAIPFGPFLCVAGGGALFFGSGSF